MPPKVESFATLIAKRDIKIASLDELLEENVHAEIAAKYKSARKQQVTIADRLLEAGQSSGDEMSANKQIGDKAKSDYLKCTEKLAIYQKKCNADKKPFTDHEKLEAMTSAVTKMADVLGSQKNANHSLEKLSVPTWDDSRKCYTTLKNEFNYWMQKYKQDAEDEQLQDSVKRYQKTRFGLIKSDQAQLSIRHGKVSTLNSEIKEN